MWDFLYPLLCFFGYGIASLFAALLTIGLSTSTNKKQVAIVSIIRNICYSGILGLLITHFSPWLLVGMILGETSGDIVAMYVKDLRWWKQWQSRGEPPHG